MAEALLGTPVEILEPEPEAPKEKRKRSTAYLAQRTVRREDALKLRQERDTVLYDPGKGSIWLGQALEHYKVHGLVFLGGVISTTEQWHLLKALQWAFADVPTKEEQLIMGGIQILPTKIEGFYPDVQVVLKKIKDVFQTFLDFIENDRLKCLRASPSEETWYRAPAQASDLMYCMKKSANNLYKQLPHMDSMFDSLRALLYVDPRGSTGTRFGSVQDWGEGKIPFIIEESKNGLPKRPKHQHLCPIMKEFCKALLEPDVIDKEMIIKGTTGHPDHLVPGGTLGFFKGNLIHAGGGNHIDRDRHLIFMEMRRVGFGLEENAQLHPPCLAQKVFNFDHTAKSLPKALVDVMVRCQRVYGDCEPTMETGLCTFTPEQNQQLQEAYNLDSNLRSTGNAGFGKQGGRSKKRKNAPIQAAV